MVFVTGYEQGWQSFLPLMSSFALFKQCDCRIFVICLCYN